MTTTATTSASTGKISSNSSTGSHSQSHSRNSADRRRSIPITIARLGDERLPIGDSSDDDDDDNIVLNEGIAGLSLGYVGSVPARQPGIRRRKPDNNTTNNNNTGLQSSSLPAAPLLVSQGSFGRERYVPNIGSVCSLSSQYCYMILYNYYRAPRRFRFVFILTTVLDSSQPSTSSDASHRKHGFDSTTDLWFLARIPYGGQIHRWAIQLPRSIGTDPWVTP